MNGIRLSVLALVISGVLSAPVYATGIPTADGVQATNMLTQYQQMLKDAETQLQQLNTAIQSYEQQVLQYKQQLLDSAKPLTDLYKSASDLYKQGNTLYSDAQSIYSKATNAKQYIDDNFGSKTFWEDCLLSGCDPTNQMQITTQEIARTSDDMIGTTIAITDRVIQNTDDLDTIMNGQKSAQGTNDLISKGNEVNATNGKMLADLTKMTAQKYADEETEKKARETRFKASIAKTKQNINNLKVTMYDDPLPIPQFE